MKVKDVMQPLPCYCQPATNLGSATGLMNSCESDRQSKFPAEVAIHFKGLEDLKKPIVWVFPELSVCPVCGAAKFTVPEAELRLLFESGNAAQAGKSQSQEANMVSNPPTHSKLN